MGRSYARVDTPDECLDIILERRGQVDVEEEEGAIIEDFFGSKLRSLGYDIETQDVFIPNDTATQWFNWATNDRRRTTGVTRALKQLSDEGRIIRILPCRVTGGNRDRGFRWVGAHCDSMANMKMDLGHRLAEKQGKTTDIPSECETTEEGEDGGF